MKTAIKIKDIEMRGKSWGLFQLSSGIAGFRLDGEDGRSYSQPIYTVLATEDCVVESNRSGEIVGFGNLCTQSGPGPALQRLGFKEV